MEIVSGSARSKAKPQPKTWTQFRSEVRKVDRDTLLVGAAAKSTEIDAGLTTMQEARWGLTPWNLAEVARTALAWGSPSRNRVNPNTLLSLCNTSSLLSDQALRIDQAEKIDLGPTLLRTFFEQFPGQRTVSGEVARALLLFGSVSEFPTGFEPEAMVPGWFEVLTQGISLDEYVESIFLIHSIAAQYAGAFSLEWLDRPRFKHVLEVASMDALRRTFTEHLLTTVSDFKSENRKFQDPLPSHLKKFAFNPLAAKPFVADVASVPISPWLQAVMQKAYAPGLYHLGISELGEAFSRDLGQVFQHYVGRQLGVIRGESVAIPEVSYGTKKQSQDSCDWFLELPDVLVLIECKARQPIEAQRVGKSDWADSVVSSVGKAIRQLNRTNRDILKISTDHGIVDASKPRVGLVVTLEPFYFNQNWIIREHLPEADFPVGVISVEELENLVTLDAQELSKQLSLLLEMPEGTTFQSNAPLVNPALEAAKGRANPLLTETWDSIPLFARMDQVIAGFVEDGHSGES